MRVGEESPKNDIYVGLPEIEEEGEQIEGFVRAALVPSPIPPRSLSERCSQSPYTSALAGTVFLAWSVFDFVIAKQCAVEDPLWSKIAYGAGSGCSAMSVSMFYLTYKRLRGAV